MPALPFVLPLVLFAIALMLGLAFSVCALAAWGCAFLLIVEMARCTRTVSFRVFSRPLALRQSGRLSARAQWAEAHMHYFQQRARKFWRAAALVVALYTIYFLFFALYLWLFRSNA